MNLFKRYKGKTKKAYSLIEVVISLGILGIIMTMLFSVLILSLQITFKILARSVVREEVSNITSLIARDIRNADDITDCGIVTGSRCELILNGQKYEWIQCGDRICKNILNGTSYENVITSPANIIFNKLTFESGFSTEDNSTRRNILVSTIASHKNESFNIKNVFKQISVSTRNYEL
jgi:type II secretory pathway pseudopilin PulG